MNLSKYLILLTVNFSLTSCLQEVRITPEDILPDYPILLSPHISSNEDESDFQIQDISIKMSEISDEITIESIRYKQPLFWELRAEKRTAIGFATLPSLPDKKGSEILHPGQKSITIYKTCILSNLKQIHYEVRIKTHEKLLIKYEGVFGNPVQNELQSINPLRFAHFARLERRAKRAGPSGLQIENFLEPQKFEP